MSGRVADDTERASRHRAAPFRCRLVIMAKAPVAGAVKTRLAREVGVATATRFARHSAAALIAACRPRSALADLAVRSRPMPALRAGTGRAACRACRKGEATSATRMQRILDRRAAGPRGDHRHRHPRHHTGAHRAAFRVLGRTTACSAGDRRRLLAGRGAPPAARRRGRSPTCAGRASTRSPTRWPTSPGRSVGFVATLSDVDDAADLARCAGFGRRVVAAAAIPAA